ncbi:MULTISPECIES: hypothetical protein [unclassified Rhizobium]|uniref:hypothetical protein n=1 Tax=unclassified Rhizobium TaxID=2613769 RepID=UPI0012E364EB|nr:MULTISPECIES: hypothetical protein [unclassified Rhizobium]
MTREDRAESRFAHRSITSDKMAFLYEFMRMLRHYLLVPIIERALTLLLTRFCDPEPDEGYLREGNVAVAQFEIEGAADDTEIREARILRQRDVNDIMREFLGALGIAFK